MKKGIESLKKNFILVSGINRRYKALRAHLDQMPVRFPATFSGVELRLLQAMFTPEEAEAALCLAYRHEPFNVIFRRAAEKGFAEEPFRFLLERMEKRGGIFAKIHDGEKLYALHPFIVGMFEMQIRRMTPGLYLDTREYVLKKFAFEYLTTQVPQMRVIPIEKSVNAAHNIATYDEIREIVDRAGDRICITDCICKTGKELLGSPCRTTDRREICMSFRDFHDTWVRNGWGRPISREEALEILDQSEKDGLVLMPANMQAPQYVCSCCSCCCGILEMLNIVPRPADFAASNYHAVLDVDACKGCGKCAVRCPMEAIRMKDKKAVAIDEKRCIGCGLCVATCKSGALQLKKKEKVAVPPEDMEALYEVIQTGRKDALGKMAATVRAVLGFARR